MAIVQNGLVSLGRRLAMVRALAEVLDKRFHFPWSVKGPGCEAANVW